MDLSSGFDLPNAYGLRAEDFDYDMDSYRAALGFLGDVGCGVEEVVALADNGGDAHLMRSWEGSQRFRRVLGKVRVMGGDERTREQPQQQSQPAVPPGFIPLDQMPVRGVFRP